MKPEIKERWLEALRSGEYKQNRGALRRGDCFCVLGVLCDLHAKETGTEWNMQPDGWHRYLDYTYTAPDPVRNWCEADALVVLNTSLVSLNDDKGLSFNELADLIEKHL